MIVITPPFRCNWTYLLKPNSFKGGEPRYKTEMIFKEGENLDDIYKAIEAVKTKAFPQGKPAYVKTPLRKGPLSDNNPNGYEPKPGLEKIYGNGVFATASNADPVGVVDRQKKPILDESQVYSGMMARAAIEVYYSKNYNKICFKLLNIQKLGDGEKIGFEKPTIDECFESLDPDETYDAPDETWEKF